MTFLSISLSGLPVMRDMGVCNAFIKLFISDEAVASSIPVRSRSNVPRSISSTAGPSSSFPLSSVNGPRAKGDSPDMDEWVAFRCINRFVMASSPVKTLHPSLAIRLLHWVETPHVTVRIIKVEGSVILWSVFLVLYDAVTDAMYIINVIANIPITDNISSCE